MNAAAIFLSVSLSILATTSAHLGSTREKLEDAYGSPLVSRGGSLAFYHQDLAITVGMENGRAAWIGFAPADGGALEEKAVLRLLADNAKREEWQRRKEGEDIWWFTASGRAATWNGERLLVYTADAAARKRKEEVAKDSK